MAKNLVIVESPAKAKTIKKFLGKDFDVKPSYGHIRDLSTKKLGIDIENNYKPEYVVEKEKQKIIKELKEAAKKADKVWLASDEDREGEAIAWHLAEVLGLDEKNAKRIVFHEITKKAIQNAIENPRWIDFNLVNAQQARRILDRFVGFELSELLWKKVQNKLSAGRVQSVAVRLLVEREQEINEFKPETWFKITALFEFEGKDKKRYELKAEAPEKFKSEKEAKDFLEKFLTASFSVEDLKTKPAKKSPPAPFTTSTLQQEASRKLGFSVNRTMQIAQKLYEEGKITYMRTDSTNLAAEAIEKIKAFVIENFGQKYSKPRQYKTKVKGAQEAHEAIRPTEMVPVVSHNRDEQRLYELIFNRTIASQMPEALYDKTTVTIGLDNDERKLTATAQVLKFDGFLKIYTYRDLDTDDEEEPTLPPLEVGQKLNLLEAVALERRSNHPPRYNEASLVRKMEELGIGRPSTYAPTISTIQKRGYVIKRNVPGEKVKFKQLTVKNGKLVEGVKEETVGSEKNKLVPTDMGIVVTDFLKKYFAEIIDYNFTANVEQDLDKIADGKQDWVKVIDSFYKHFHKIVETTTKEAVKEKRERLLGQDPETGKNVYAKIGRYGPIIQLGDTGDDETPKFASIPKHMHIDQITLEEALELLSKDPNGTLIGKDPETGKPVYTRWTKYGPVVQFGTYDNGEKPKYINLPKTLNINTLTLEQALELKKLPKKIGTYNGKDLTLGIGKFGPYVLYDDKFYSVSTKYNILELGEKEAIEIIEAYNKKLQDNTLREFEGNPDLKIVKYGRGQKRIYYKRKYYKLPPKIDIDKLTEEDCMKIIEEQMPKKKTTKKTAAKKTTAKKTTTKKTTTKKTTAKKSTKSKKSGDK